MEFYEVLRKRRTIRDFTGQVVSDELLAKVLNTGLQAPTNDHLRQLEFVVVKGKENISRLVADFDKNYDLVLDGIREEAAKGNIDADKYDMFMHAVPRQKRMLIESGCVVIPFFRQGGAPLLQPEKLHSLNYFASAWASLENIILAATAEGLMTCLQAIGYQAPDAHICKQVQIDIRDRIHKNKW